MKDYLVKLDEGSAGEWAICYFKPSKEKIGDREVLEGELFGDHIRGYFRRATGQYIKIKCGLSVGDWFESEEVPEIETIDLPF